MSILKDEFLSKIIPYILNQLVQKTHLLAKLNEGHALNSPTKSSNAQHLVEY